MRSVGLVMVVLATVAVAEEKGAPQADPPVAGEHPLEHAAPAAPPRRDTHVPLEQKEITIESLDDIRKLSAELKAAKQRHTAQGAAE